MADETALLPLGFAAIAEAAVDFPCGFIVAEEANCIGGFLSVVVQELSVFILCGELVRLKLKATGLIRVRGL
ncbi:unnamed protein product [Brassica rapa subsp. narinosa]